MHAPLRQRGTHRRGYGPLPDARKSPAALPAVLLLSPAIGEQSSKTPRMRYSLLPCPVIAVPGAVSCKAPPPPSYSINYAEKRAALPNGLRPVIIPDKTTPLFKLPGDYYGQLIKRVAALSTAQVKALRKGPDRRRAPPRDRDRRLRGRPRYPHPRLHRVRARHPPLYRDRLSMAVGAGPIVSFFRRSERCVGAIGRCGVSR